MKTFLDPNYINIPFKWLSKVQIEMILLNIFWEYCDSIIQ